MHPARRRTSNPGSRPVETRATESSAAAGSGATAAPPAAAGALVITGTDPCTLLTREQVEAAFGFSVSEVAPGRSNTSQFSQNCDFTISEYSKLTINIYQGEGAKNYFALLITAAGQSCDELFETFFEVAFAPLTEKYPSADAALLTLPLDDLYRRYVGVLGECMYVHSQDRPDAGSNLLAAETIFLETSSNVTVLGEDRVVEFIYQEAFSPDLELALQQGTSKEAFHAIADPYRQEVLSGYTEKLIGLAKQAAGH
jgi:hypothetical protein